MMAYQIPNDARPVEKFSNFVGPNSILDQWTEESLTRLHDLFVTAGEAMNESELQTAFETILEISLPEEAFHMLFKKMNFKGDDLVTWNEFISYLLLEYGKHDKIVQRYSLEHPLVGHPQILRTHHRTSVCKIVFYPEVRLDRSTNFQQGCYLTVSKDGIINFWSLDLEYQRSVHSKNPYLKVQSTVITDMIVMPDVQIVCTSSIECDLRFYDTTAKKFDLRLMISGLECPIVCLYYYFSTDMGEDSYIILGDTNGSIKIFTFSPVDKGPFKQQSQQGSLHVRYEAVARGELQGLKVTEIKAAHSNWVSQVAYYGTIRAFVSSSRCSDCSLLLSDPTGTKMQYKFSVTLGISCFTFCEESQLLVTGGPDCIVRTWNPFVPNRANVVLQGHQAAISALVVQSHNQRLYSLSNDRCIKVWDLISQSCIQTYNGLPRELSEYTPMTVIYNTLTHKMIIASMMIAVVTCERVINEETSDGYTHGKPVSCVLYNTLFKLIITTGWDSCIMTWDPWQGKLLRLVRNAHSRQIYSSFINVEITAACFDHISQLLLTGARDGSLKVWNFRTGTCLRRMAIDTDCEVTSVVWLDNRILCTGWDRRVTEFAVSGLDVCKKNWEIRHTDDVLCSAIYSLTTLATGSYDGELVLWRLETGQAYRKYRLNDPIGRYPVMRARDVPNEINKQPNRNNFNTSNTSMRYRTCPHQESTLSMMRVTSVRAMIFLKQRRTAPDVGTLLISLESGLIQVWSHHPAGAFLSSFSASHTAGDCVDSLETDPDNQFLITARTKWIISRLFHYNRDDYLRKDYEHINAIRGHRVGYIKVWFLGNYELPDPPELCMPLLRLEFPFLWKDRIDGRAKRAVRDQPLPMLLSAFRGHKTSVICLQFIPNARIIVSGSKDHTVRLWTMGGRYISTLGTFREWSPIISVRPAFQYLKKTILPADLKRTASFTTIKLFHGGLKQMHVDEEVDDSNLTKEVPEEERHVLYGDRLTIPILGNHYKLPVRIKSRMSL